MLLCFFFSLFLISLLLFFYTISAVVLLLFDVWLFRSEIGFVFPMQYREITFSINQNTAILQYFVAAIRSFIANT